MPPFFLKMRQSQLVIIVIIIRMINIHLFISDRLIDIYIYIYISFLSYDEIERKWDNLLK